jgi:predicted AAA+ superfamily ATPase
MAILPNDTLIILDEVQNCKETISFLKIINEFCNQYHVIAIGSLLELTRTF